MNDVFAAPQPPSDTSIAEEALVAKTPRRVRHTENDHTRSVIKPKLLVRLSYKNLLFKKLRTTLTAAGVVVGIGAVVFLFSFGIGLQNLINKQVIGSSSVNAIDVT